MDFCSTIYLFEFDVFGQAVQSWDPRLWLVPQVTAKNVGRKEENKFFKVCIKTTEMAAVVVMMVTIMRHHSSPLTFTHSPLLQFFFFFLSLSLCFISAAHAHWFLCLTLTIIFFLFSFLCSGALYTQCSSKYSLLILCCLSKPVTVYRNWTQ